MLAALSLEVSNTSARVSPRHSMFIMVDATYNVNDSYRGSAHSLDEFLVFATAIQLVESPSKRIPHVRETTTKHDTYI